MRFKVTIGSLLVLAMVVTACGGTGNDASTTTRAASDSNGDGGGNGGSDNGEGSTSGGSGSIADDARADAEGAGEDFPVPIPGGWETDQLAELVSEGASGFQDGVALEYSSDDFNALVSFYDDWFADLPDQAEWVRSEGEGFVIYQRSSPLIQIAVNRDFDGSLDSDTGPITFLSISVARE